MKNFPHNPIIAASSSPQKGTPRRWGSATDGAPQQINLAKLVSVQAGTRFHLNALITNVFPLKEIAAPNYTGVVLNFSLADSSCGLRLIIIIIDICSNLT